MTEREHALWESLHPGQDCSQHWRDIHIDQLPAATIRRWGEHPEEMTMNELTALKEYLSRHPDMAAQWGLTPPHTAKPEREE